MDSRQALEHIKREANSMPDFQADGKPLGKYITDRFIGCNVGKKRLYYEQLNKTLFIPTKNYAFRRLSTQLNKLSIKVFRPKTA